MIAEDASDRLRIERLADHPEVLPVLEQWFKTEWASWYGPGGPGDARRDLLAFAAGNGLPIALIAFDGDQLCGIAALRADSLTSDPDLRPWVAAGLVSPALRGRGIGTELVRALETLAREMGFSRIFCGTNTAGRLLERRGWHLREQVERDGAPLDIFEKAL